MSGKIVAALAAAMLLASTGLASAENQAPRHHKEHPRYYNMVPNQAPADPAPYTGADYSGSFGGTGVTGQGQGR